MPACQMCKLHRIWEDGLYKLYPDGQGGYCNSMKQFHDVYQQQQHGLIQQY